MGGRGSSSNKIMTPRERINQGLHAMGYSDDEINTVQKLFDAHTSGHSLQKEADAEIYKHIEDGDRIGQLLMDKSKMELKEWERKKQQNYKKQLEAYNESIADIEKELRPGGLYSNYTKQDLEDWNLIPVKPERSEPLVYRAGGMDKNVLSFTTSSEGAHMGGVHDEGIGWDVAFTMPQMKKMGYIPIAGIIGADVGIAGEAEVLFVKKPKRKR